MFRKSIQILSLSFAAVFASLGSPATAQESPASKSSTNEAEPAVAPELWFGTLNLGTQRLRLLLEISAQADGSLSAVLVSLDQGKSRLAADSLTWGDQDIAFAVDRVKASFRGTRQGDSKIAGTFKQGVEFPLTLTRVKEVPEEKVIEAWAGDLDAGGQTLRLQFRLLRDQNDQETVLFDSLTQHASGLLAKWNVEGGKVKAQVPAVRGIYEGELSEDGREIVGTWTQLGNALELKLIRVESAEKVPEHKRPQLPPNDVPYHREDVSFRNEAADVELSGTLTLPEGDAPFPSVVLVSGLGRRIATNL